jgi:cell division protein FtsA
MEEIIEHIMFEIRNSGYEKKLIAGIVLTGGGAQLKHILQLTQFATGMDVRIGYPNEHLSKECPEEMVQPMFATGVGLVSRGIAKHEKELRKQSINQKDEKKDKNTRRDRTSFFDKIKGLFEEEGIQ